MTPEQEQALWDFVRPLAAGIGGWGNTVSITYDRTLRDAAQSLIAALSVSGEAPTKPDPPSLCQCGHLESVHDHGRSCFADCGCRAFRRDLQPEGPAPPPEKEREGIPKRLTHPERRFFEAAQEGWAALRTVLHFGEDKPGLAAENIDNAWLLLDRAPPEKEPRPMWKLEMTCCGREEPPSYHATWEEADATREAWLSNAEHGRGHSDRSATIVRAAPPKEPPAPRKESKPGEPPIHCTCGSEGRWPHEITCDVYPGSPAETRSVEEEPLIALGRLHEEALARASALRAERDDLAARLKHAAEMATRRTFLREDLLAILEGGGSSGKGDR